MSTLLSEQSIEIVKITLNKRDVSGTSTYYLAQEYFATDAIYSGSPEVFPILAASPALSRAVGINVMELPNTTISINGRTDFDRKGRSFISLQETHDFHNAAITFLYYAKAIDGTTTHSDSVNIRGVGKVISISYGENGQLNLSSQDEFFKDKSFAKYFKSSDFSALESDWDGELRPTVFGRYSASLGVVMPGTLIYHTQTDGSGHRTRARWFTGNAWSDNKMNSLSKIYVRTQSTRFDSTEWLETNIVANPDTAICGNATTSTSINLRDQWVGIDYSPTQTQIATHARIYTKGSASLVDDDGELRVVIYEGKKTIGSFKQLFALGKAVYENGDISGSSPDYIVAPLDSPIVLNSSNQYLIAIEWSNINPSATPYALAYYGAGADGFWIRYNDESERVWVKISSGLLSVRLYGLGFATADFVDYDSSNRSSYVQFQTYDPTTVQSPLDASDLRSLQFKLSVNGIEDDSSGTYTGSASSLIYNPADLIRYLAADSKYGAVGTGNIDSTSFNAARSALSSVSVGALIDESMTVEELIFRLCREFRLILYTTREGKIALRFPVPVTSTFDTIVSETRLRGDLRILSIAPQSYSDVINDALIDYSPDYLYTPRDVARNRKAKKLKHRNAIYVNKDESGTSDGQRKAACNNSHSLYGARIFRETWDYIHEESSANNVMEYYLDRYSKLQSRLIFRVPRKDYFSTIDLFSTIRIEHKDVPLDAGASSKIAEYSSGQQITPTYEGVKLPAWAGGIFSGEVVRITETGNYMEVTVETVSSFEGA